MLRYKAADVDSESSHIGLEKKSCSLILMNLIKCLLCCAVASHLTYMLFDLQI